MLEGSKMIDLSTEILADSDSQTKLKALSLLHNCPWVFEPGASNRSKAESAIKLVEDAEKMGKLGQIYGQTRSGKSILTNFPKSI